MPSSENNPVGETKQREIDKYLREKIERDLLIALKVLPNNCDRILDALERGGPVEQWQEITLFLMNAHETRRQLLEILKSIAEKNPEKISEGEKREWLKT